MVARRLAQQEEAARRLAQQKEEEARRRARTREREREEAEKKLIHRPPPPDYPPYHALLDGPDPYAPRIRQIGVNLISNMPVNLEMQVGPDGTRQVAAPEH